MAVAGLLHDELQQLLVAAKLHLQGLNRSIGGDPRAGTIAQRVQQLIDEAIRTARGLSRIVEVAMRPFSPWRSADFSHSKPLRFPEKAACLPKRAK